MTLPAFAAERRAAAPGCGAAAARRCQSISFARTLTSTLSTPLPAKSCGRSHANANAVQHGKVTVNISSTSFWFTDTSLSHVFAGKGVLKVLYCDISQERLCIYYSTIFVYGKNTVTLHLTYRKNEWLNARLLWLLWYRAAGSSCHPTRQQDFKRESDIVQ